MRARGRRPWPASLTEQAQNWPLHLFGSANAWVIYVGPNPGPLKVGQLEYIEPHEPTLGGTPHPHVAGYRYPSWTKLRNLVEAGFRGILTRDEALASFLLANLGPDHSPRSVLGRDFGADGFARVARALRVCQPRLVVAQREEVYEIILRHVEVRGATRFATNLKGWTRKRVEVRFEGRPFLLACAEAHFSQGWSQWSTHTYLPLLTREALHL